MIPLLGDWYSIWIYYISEAGCTSMRLAVPLHCLGSNANRWLRLCWLCQNKSWFFQDLFILDHVVIAELPSSIFWTQFFKLYFFKLKLLSLRSLKLDVFVFSTIFVPQTVHLFGTNIFIWQFFAESHFSQIHIYCFSLN